MVNSILIRKFFMYVVVVVLLLLLLLYTIRIPLTAQP